MASSTGTRVRRRAGRTRSTSPPAWTAIEADRKAARAITTEERKSYYEIFQALPSIDVAGALTKGKQDFSTLLKEFDIKPKDTGEAVEKKIRENESLIEQLEALQSKYTDELTAIGKPSTNKEKLARVAAVKAHLQALDTKIGDTRIELAAERAKLAGLQTQ